MSKGSILRDTIILILPVSGNLIELILSYVSPAKISIKNTITSILPISENLISLIFSYLDPREIFPQYILGPVTLTEHISQKYRKWFYIFGDVHVRGGTCPSEYRMVSIAEQLQLVLEENPEKTIDIYLEYPYLSKDIQNSTSKYTITPSYLDDVVNTFDLCLRRDKSVCPYPNVRFHYIDVRQTNNRNINLTQYYGHMDMFRRNIRYRQKTPLLLKILDRLDLYISKKVIYPLNMERIFTQLKIYKQYENITDVTLRSLLWNYFVSQIKNSISTINTYENLTSLMYKNIRAFLEKKESAKDLWSFEIMLAHFDRLMTLLMDMYTMGRIFRSYQQIPGRYSEDAQYIIIYTGDAHSKKYRQILDQILQFQRLHDIRSGAVGTKYFQCLNISSLQSPFFSR